MMLAQPKYMTIDLDMNMFPWLKQKQLYKFTSENRRAWNNLKTRRVRNNKKIKYLHTDNCGDVHTFEYHDPSTFTNVHTIFATRCDKNFVYYWLNYRHFPNLQTLYLMSHPCEPTVLRQNGVKIIMDHHWKKYKNIWDSNDCVELYTKEEILDYMDTFESIDIELLD